MTDDDKYAEGPMGEVEGTIKVLTPEEYEQAVRKRNAEEAAGDLEDSDDDLSDLGELGELFDDDDEQPQADEPKL